MHTSIRERKNSSPITLVRIVTTALVFVAAPSTAQAYVDPGLGGQLFQFVYIMVFVGLAAVTFPFRAVRRVIRRWKSGNRRSPPAQE